MINNKVTLTGNLGHEPEFKTDKNGNEFAVLRLATQDAYVDKETGEIKQKESVWHDVLVFRPSIVQNLKYIKSGVRIEINGTLSYQPLKVTLEGKEVSIQTTSVVAYNMNLAPLVKKNTGEISSEVDNSSEMLSSDKTEVSSDISYMDNPQD